MPDHRARLLAELEVIRAGHTPDDPHGESFTEDWHEPLPAAACFDAAAALIERASEDERAAMTLSCDTVPSEDYTDEWQWVEVRLFDGNRVGVGAPVIDVDHQGKVMGRRHYAHIPGAEALLALADRSGG